VLKCRKSPPNNLAKRGREVNLRRQQIIFRGWDSPVLLSQQCRVKYDNCSRILRCPVRVACSVTSQHALCYSRNGVTRLPSSILNFAQTVNFESNYSMASTFQYISVRDSSVRFINNFSKSTEYKTNNRF